MDDPAANESRPCESRSKPLEALGDPDEREARAAARAAAQALGMRLIRHDPASEQSPKATE